MAKRTRFQIRLQYTMWFESSIMGVFVILKYIEILSEIRKSVNPVTFIFKLLGIKQ